MVLDKVVNDNGMYLYQTSDYNTINIQLSFVKESGDREDAILDLLCLYLAKTNKTYDNEYELNKKKTELYSLDWYYSFSKLGDLPLGYFYVDLVAPSVVKDNYMEEAVKFIHEIFFNTDFTKEETLDSVKRVFLVYLINNLSVPDKIARNLYERKVLRGKNIEYKCATDIDYITNLINSITLEELEAMYKKVFCKESFYRGVVLGNFTDEEYQIFRKDFDFVGKKERVHSDVQLDILDEDLEIIDENVNEPVLYVTYSLDGIDETVKKLLIEILNGSSDLCMQILREKYRLVYTAFAVVSRHNYLFIRAKIKGNNKEIAVKAIEEIIETIKDKEKLKPLLEKAKEAYKLSFYILDENKDNVLDMIDNHVCEAIPGFNEEEFERNIDSYTPEDIVKYTKSLKRKSIFMYRGDNHE